MNTFFVLVVAILSIAGVLIALSGWILVNKAIRESRSAADQRRRARLEPRILSLIHADGQTPGIGEWQPAPGEGHGMEAGRSAGDVRGVGDRPGIAGGPAAAAGMGAGSGSADGWDGPVAGAATDEARKPRDRPGIGAGTDTGRRAGDDALMGDGPSTGDGPATGDDPMAEDPGRGAFAVRPNAFREALGGFPAGAGRRAVEAILVDHAVRVRGVARDRISQAFEELGYVDRYLSGLRARRWWRRADSAERLGLARSRRAIDPLVALMSDSIPEVRLRAAKALGEIRGKAAVRPLLDALAQPNRWSTLRVADILSRMGSEAAEGIRAAWPALPRPAQLAALDILGKIHTLESVDFLRTVLQGSDRDLRARAAHALGMIGHAGPVEDLVRALRDPEWPVRAMAAKALGRIGSPEAVEPLVEALKDEAWWVRSNAATALRLIGPRGQRALIDVLDDTDIYARHQAVLMMQESGVLAEYVAQLDSSEDISRKAAEGVIRRLIELGRTDFLDDQAREYPNSRVRARLGELLDQGRAPA